MEHVKMESGHLNCGADWGWEMFDNQKPQSILALYGYNWTLLYFDIKLAYSHMMMQYSDTMMSHTAIENVYSNIIMPHHYVIIPYRSIILIEVNTWISGHTLNNNTNLVLFKIILYHTYCTFLEDLLPMKLLTEDVIMESDQLNGGCD